MAEWLEEIKPCVSPNRSVEYLYAHGESSLSLKHFPSIKLLLFSFFEKVEKWQTFCNQFTTFTINNKNLSDFVRMHFLVSSLMASARVVIDSIERTADNFIVTWQAFCMRFEKKRQLIEVNVASLYNLLTISERLKCAAKSRGQGIRSTPAT